MSPSPGIATHHWGDWSLASLLELKKASGLSVSLVVPARNEAATVGSVIARVRSALVSTVELIDEIVVIDSDSSDATASVAAAAGASVFSAAGVRPDLGSFPGKGEAMWKSLFVTSGDVIVFMDADLVEWDTHFIPGLLGPLLSSPTVELVKGFYERPGEHGPLDGGRVTELVARPALALWWPLLAGVVQPLAGEWAVRRSLFSSLSVPVGYAVEIAALIDTLSSRGAAAIAQVDLGVRGHRHQPLLDLGVMSAQLLAAVSRRLPPSAPPALLPPPPRRVAGFLPPNGGFPGAESGVALTQWARSAAGEVEPVVREVETVERPPAISVGLGDPQ